ncbi:BTAD domain-containing putative transcriptional regulator [Lentzea sp. BCCO 10_0061]|uniref:BTAD domain-containing putative transcriptional regulator n=1 Tax=Lentzea sokolovensis TaxID=3095429 RepID=A0ABU4USW6_9PSEU|nr:BTAD domain-containing putative transcriptional regulator [Lentzea sp. BCCO 10_0061]MDX8142574.1 BTAD domain-containing putative transcriptional regulator [Lentzea sp. BCCO 10_0061]
MEFLLLGSLAVRRTGTLLELGGPRQRAVLTMLLLHANEAVSVAQLTEAVWDSPPVSPESNLRTYVAGLRKVLGERLITHPGHGYQLVVDPGELDLDAFDQLVREGENALADNDSEAAADLFGQALGRWHGIPTAELNAGPLLRAEFTRIQERRLTAVERFAKTSLELGRFDDVIDRLRRETALHPLREELWAQLMLALDRSGRRSEALEAFATARRHVVEQIGVEPGARLRQLQQVILESRVPSPAALNAHRQLPMDIAEFTGRESELRRLCEPGPQTTVVISAIEGMAGVGKTKLAVRAAHRLVQRFPDVQLWADLHGFDADELPADPSAVLESFLRLLGVPGGQIPASLEERAALYRDRLTDKRALVLLDNAAGEDQVRPLLPGSSTCMVLITSRRTLLRLDGVQSLFLDVFTPGEALALFSRIAGEDRVQADREAAERIAELCGHLPIAVALAAKRLARRPQWTMRDLVDQLERGGGLGVRGVFDLSYQALPDNQRRLFRLLGLHPGEDFSADSAAALAGLTPHEAGDLLETLLDEHLLQQHTPGRYGLHDLLRTYAVEQVTAAEPPPARALARRRVLDWYVHTSWQSAQQLNPQRKLDISPADPVVHARSFADRDAALLWCDTERANLVAAVRDAAGHELPEHCWSLAQCLWDFFNLRKHWADWLDTHSVALAAARSVGDRSAEGRMLITLGIALREVRRHEESIECNQQALAIFRATGDKARQEPALNNLGIVYMVTGRPEDALACYEQSAEIARELGNLHSEAVTLNNIALLHADAGRFDVALARYLRALEIRKDIKDPYSEAILLNNIGEVYRGLLDFPEAVSYVDRALETFRAIGDLYGQAESLDNLGLALDGLGDRRGAEKCWLESVTLFEELGEPKADEVRARL